LLLLLPELLLELSWSCCCCCWWWCKSCARAARERRDLFGLEGGAVGGELGGDGLDLRREGRCLLRERRPLLLQRLRCIGDFDQYGSYSQSLLLLELRAVGGCAGAAGASGAAARSGSARDEGTYRRVCGVPRALLGQLRLLLRRCAPPRRLRVSGRRRLPRSPLRTRQAPLRRA